MDGADSQGTGAGKLTCLRERLIAGRGAGIESFSYAVSDLFEFVHFSYGSLGGSGGC
jgi:hypothetical protein